MWPILLPRDPPKELLPPAAGELGTRPCDTEGGWLKTRAGAELEDRLLAIGGLKVLPSAARGSPELFLGWLTLCAFGVLWFARIGP